MSAFVVLGLVPSIQCEVIGWKELPCTYVVLCWIDWNGMELTQKWWTMQC